MKKVRVSVGNLVTRIVNGETGEERLLGLLNKKALLKKNLKKFTVLGGACEMTVRGKEKLEKEFKAEFLEGMDARFLIDGNDLQKVMDLFQSRDENLYEIDPIREIIEELTEKELPIINNSILDKKDLEDIQIEFIKGYRESDKDSMRSEYPTERYFNLYKMILGNNVYDKLKNSEAVLLIDKEMEKFIGNKLPDGRLIGDNIIK